MLENESTKNPPTFQYLNQSSHVLAIKSCQPTVAVGTHTAQPTGAVGTHTFQLTVADGTHVTISTKNIHASSNTDNDMDPQSEEVIVSQTRSMLRSNRGMLSQTDMASDEAAMTKSDGHHHKMTSSHRDMTSSFGMSDKNFAQSTSGA